MWNKPEKPVAIDPSQVIIGMYVWLNVSWDDHPFLCNRFKISDEKQVATIRSLPIQGKLFYHPEKSTATPAPFVAGVARDPSVVRTAEEEEVDAVLAAEIVRLNQEKRDRLQKHKDAAARADRAWEQAARVASDAMHAMGRAPKQAGEQFLNLSRSTASLISQGQEVLLHLLGDKEGEGAQFHALNVMTLSMLVGKIVGMEEDQLAELALGTLAHDIGKIRVPARILRAKNRAKHEEVFYREHGTYGIELARMSGVFGATAISVIADHHEYMDGSGWPNGKTSAGLAARITALVDRYDRLCSPESPDQEALLPSEALARLFKIESAKFDQRLLKILIRLLGVYPPGTLVKLSDDSLGLVVAPGKESLRPTVLIYSPDMEKREAPTIDLSQFDDLKIEEALRPASLPSDVLRWMNPRQRLSYFFSTEQTN